MAESARPRQRGTTGTVATWKVFTPAHRSMLENRCAAWGDARISGDKSNFVRFSIRDAYDPDKNLRYNTGGRVALSAILQLIVCAPLSGWAAALCKSSQSLLRYLQNYDGGNDFFKDLYECFHVCGSLIDDVRLIATADKKTVELKFKCKNAASAKTLLGEVVTIKRLGNAMGSIQDWVTDPQYAGTSGYLYTISSNNYGGGAAVVYAGYLVPYSSEQHESQLTAEQIQTAITEEHENQAANENAASEYRFDTASNDYHTEEIKNGTTMWKTLRYIGLGVVILLLIPVVLNFFKKQKGKK